MTQRAGPIFRLLKQRFQGEICGRELLPPGSRVLVALSGGQDSLALTELLRSPWPLASACSVSTVSKCNCTNFTLALAHVDHCWPGDSGCAEHVSRYAERVGLTLHVADPNGYPVPRSEAGARMWRYSALTEIAELNGYTHVATGHTLSDLAETLVFNLVHGAGADGLGSLTWKRSLAPSVTLIRPLLSVSRTETAAFCEERGVHVWSDIYNSDPRYARFRTREHVIPYFRKHFNPQVEEALAKTAHLLRDEADALEGLASTAYKRVVRLDLTGMCVYVCQSLAEEPVAIQRRVMRRVLVDVVGVHQRTAMFKQVENLIGLLSSPDAASIPSLPNGRSASVRGSEIAIRFVGIGEKPSERSSSTPSSAPASTIRHRVTQPKNRSNLFASQIPAEGESQVIGGVG